MAGVDIEGTPPSLDDAAPAAKKPSSDLLPRLLSGIVMVAGAVFALYAGGLIWAGLILIGAVVLCFEWQHMTDASDAPGGNSVLLAAVVAAILVVMFVWGVVPASMMLAAWIIIAFVAHFLQPGRSWLWMALGAAYVSLPSASLIWLRDQTSPNGIALMLFLFVAVWGTDIGAYFVGRSVGGPKIFPSISPKKTWSGSIGGALIAALGVVVLKPALGLTGSYFALAIAGLFMSILCQLGDAFESALKRRFGIKDSGSLIPGHGGLLDRLDGLLFCAPVLAVVIWVSL